MAPQEKIDFLIHRLADIVKSCVRERDFLAARLYQRDLILLMVQCPKYSARQIGEAYFTLAELCSKVGDFKGVNKFVARASTYNQIGSQGKPSALGKMFADATPTAFPMQSTRPASILSK